MISHDSARHNAGRLFPLRGLPILTLLLAAAALLLLGSCGTKDQGGSTSAKTTARCPAVMDTGGWDAFKTLGDRYLAGEQVTAAELEAFGNEPAVTVWRESMTENVPSAVKVGNWVESAFWDVSGQGRTQKMNSDRITFGQAMRFSYDKRQDIDPLLARFTEEGHLCDLYDLANRWLDPAKLPDPFVVRFLASKPELRSHNGALVADTGLLLAGGPKQLVGQMAAILYRDRQALPGPSPLEMEGAEAVAQTLRVMLNEGVAAWIEDMPHTYFNPVHPRLAKVVFVPENVFAIGVRALDIFNTNLPRLLADEAVMAGSGQDLARAIAGSGAFTQGGYCMAAVIAARLGEDRLHAVRLSPPAFLEAYQEAALQNALPLPLPGAEGSQLYETMPAFEGGVYEGLLKVLEEHFPRTATR